MPSNPTKKIGLIAGAGEIPIYFARKASLNGTRLISIGFSDAIQSSLFPYSEKCYSFGIGQPNKILDTLKKNDVEDLYNPIGCWSPTFKASYNDISTLVQFALKHINIMVSNKKLNSFVINQDNNYEYLKVSKF